ncbi:iron-containing alcohol dehydrogenase [Micromonospora sp. STR1s_5]|nr:iron-containing alcohol dehydrogenase [Micromonospora sp. STR1s_5]
MSAPSMPARRFLGFPLPDVWFGQGCIGELTKVLARDEVSRVVVITGRSLAGNEDLMGRLRTALSGRHAGTFADTIPHVPRRTVLAAAEACMAAGADAIVSFGGSTPNDTAKAAALALAEDFRREEDFDRFAIRFRYPSTRIEVPISGRALPIYAVPTTLSAGEFTAYAGVTDPAGRHKDLFRDPQLVARAVFLDPELTRATPEQLWLSTGMKAVDHCVEAWLSTRAQPLTDAVASYAFATLNRCLPVTRRDPADLAARLECQIAAWMSVLGLSNVTLGLSHGLGHQLGGVAAPRTG